MIPVNIRDTHLWTWEFPNRIKQINRLKLKLFKGILGARVNHNRNRHQKASTQLKDNNTSKCYTTYTILIMQKENRKSQKVLRKFKLTKTQQRMQHTWKEQFLKSRGTLSHGKLNQLAWAKICRVKSMHKENSIEKEGIRIMIPSSQAISKLLLCINHKRAMKSQEKCTTIRVKQ